MKVYFDSEQRKAIEQKQNKSKLLFFFFSSRFLISFLVVGCLTVFFLKKEIQLSVHNLFVNGGHGIYNTNIRVREKLRDIPIYFYKNMMSYFQDEVPQVSIDIKFKDYKKLAVKREVALEKGILIQGDDDYVPAKIRIGDQITNVKLRLKGDWVDHLEGDKWSFRVHTKKNESIFSLRRFSIQDPKTRGFQGEVLFHETLSFYNILIPQYFFVSLKVNGESKGIMAVEEHFSKELLERNGRKEGVIVKFDESLVWASNDGNERGFGGIYDNYKVSEIKPFSKAKIQKSESLENSYKLAAGLLRGFVNGNLSASDVFDSNQLGSYIAASQFWGAWHAVRWHNLRFYFNPISLKLEPIAFDANLQDRLDIGVSLTSEPIVAHFLEDKEIRKFYNKTLDSLHTETKSGELIERLKVREAPVLSVLNREFLFLDGIDKDELVNRAKVTRINEMEYLKTFNTYRYKTVNHDSTEILEISNITPKDTQIQAVKLITDSGETLPINWNDTPDFPILVHGTKQGNRPSIYKFKYTSPSETNDYNVVLEFIEENSTKIKMQQVDRYVGVVLGHPFTKLSKLQSLKKNEFLEINESMKLITVKPGKWRVYDHIIIPREFTLTMSKGTTLLFSENNALISFGATKFIGTPNKPITLQGVDTDVKEGWWSGVVVQESAALSEWENVIIKNTQGINVPGWTVTGGTSFYKSDLNCNNCTFNGNKAEDALNVTNANIFLVNTKISETISDGFDGDYVSGTIVGGLFSNIGKAGGGDAIDFSGSQVSVENVEFLNIEDKALSVGERSQVVAKNLRIMNVGVGAASKDGSTLTLKKSSIDSAKIAGLMSYRKKHEYDFAKLDASIVSIKNTVNKALVESGSQMVLNNSNIESTNIDISNLYDTVMKSSLR